MNEADNKPDEVKILSITTHINDLVGLGDDGELYVYNRNARKWAYRYGAPPKVTVKLDLNKILGDEPADPKA